jgi:glycosyltransferase involved in cell wall biosynthesis
MLISFIVPVFNAEKYLEICVKSITESRFTDYEILLINDGSNDKSYEIMEKLEQTNTSIRIFNKENGGASSARNVGLGEAKGDYISFVDSDDYIIDGERIDDIEKTLSVKNYDLLLVDIAGRVQKEKVELDNTEIIILACTTDRLSSPCAKFYRTEILKNNFINFDEAMRTGEDSNFNAKASRYICKACYMDYEFYHYRHNPVSLSNTFNMDIFNDLMKNFNTKKRVLIETNNFNEFSKAFYCLFTNSHAFYFLKLYKFDIQKCKIVLKDYKNNDILNEILDNVQLKDFIFKYKILYLIAKYKSMFLLRILSMLV